MKFKEIYELTDLIAGNADAITFKAFDTFSGREVFVHMLQAATPVSADALAGAGIEVIDSGRHREQPFIITPALTDFSGLGGLLDRKRSRPPAKEPGDFTGMFQTEKSSEPGEFTRMFQSGGPSKPSPMPATPPESREPGEFTRMFQSGGPSKSSAKPPTPSEQLKPPPPAVAPATPAEGEFTRLFHPPAPKQATWTPPAAAKPAEPDWAPKLRWEDGGGPPEAATGVFSPPVERKKAPQSDDTGPSDFTRVISSSRPPRQAAAPPAAPESPVPAPQSTAVDAPPPRQTAPSYLPLILILGGLFLLALIVVLYFALRG
jgi:hypothetical protein